MRLIDHPGQQDLLRREPSPSSMWGPRSVFVEYGGIEGQQGYYDAIVAVSADAGDAEGALAEVSAAVVLAVNDTAGLQVTDHVREDATEDGFLISVTTSATGRHYGDAIPETG